MISIIGSGKVGSALAFLLATNSLDDITLVNRTKYKAIGEVLDISNAIPENSEITITGTDNFSKISASKIVVITASTGIYHEDRTELMSSQIEMTKEIAMKIKQFAPDAIVLMVSNPVDVLTFVFQRESNFPKNKVIGVASSLDTARFRFIISKKLSIRQSQISDALVLGEHGDSMVPIFSNTKVKGKNLLEIISEIKKEEIHKEVRDYWRLLRENKSRSQYGIAKNTYDIVKTIIYNQEIFLPISTVLEGEYGQSTVSMGVPCLIDKNGIVKIQEVKLDDSENKLFNNSAQTIKNYLESFY